VLSDELPFSVCCIMGTRPVISNIALVEIRDIKERRAKGMEEGLVYL